MDRLRIVTGVNDGVPVVVKDLNVPEVSQVINEVTNPSFEVDTAGWTIASGCTGISSTEQAGVGSRSLKVTRNVGAGVGVIRAHTDLIAAPGDTFSASCLFRPAATLRTAIVYVQFLDAANAVLATHSASASESAGSFVEIRVENKTAPSSTAKCRVMPSIDSGAESEVHYFDAVIAVKDTTVPAYFDGDTDGYEWSGTAHASTSAPADRFQLIRDTFKLTPPERRQQFSDPSRRYGGARLASESHGNGTLSAEWLVDGATPDAALSNVEAFLEQLDILTPDRFIEWRPDGATNSTYYEIEGPGPWEPTYQWITFQSTQTLKLSATWAIAPLGQGLPLTVLSDDFSSDTLGNYTFDGGAGTLSVSGGELVPSDTSNKEAHHHAAGKFYDAHVTLKYKTGASIAGITGVLHKYLDGTNYIMARTSDDGASSFLSIYVNNNDDFATNQSVSIARLVANTTYWIRLRVEGNSITAEHWATAPSETAAATTTTALTLTGANATKFGPGVEAHAGFKLTPAGTDWRYDDFKIEPNVYRQRTLPATFTVSAPTGTAPSLADVTVTKTDSGIPIFALLAWMKQAKAALGGSVAPWGIIEAETGANLSTWASTSDATARGGTLLRHTATGAHTGLASYSLDPSTVAPDDFLGTEFQLEVWARVKLPSTIQVPSGLAWVEPADGTAFGSGRFTAEHGTVMKPLSTAGTDGYRFTRLGVITLDTFKQKAWKLWIRMQTAAGSTGTWGLDYLVLVPAMRRALTPTGKAADTSYPKFVPTTSATKKLIRSDLSATISSVGGVEYPDTGLGGTPIEVPNSVFDMLLKLSNTVPDVTTVENTETLSHIANVLVKVTPRYRLVA